MSQKLIDLMRRRNYFVIVKEASDMVKVNLHHNVAYAFNLVVFLGFHLKLEQNDSELLIFREKSRASWLYDQVLKCYV